MLLTQTRVSVHRCSYVSGPQKGKEAVMDATQPIRLHPLGSFRSHVNSVSNKAVPQEASEDTMLLNQFPNQKWAQLGAA